MTPEFRAGERDRGCRLLCCDCGKPAEGNVTCDDGELCDACHAEDMSEPMNASDGGGHPYWREDFHSDG